MKKNVLFIFILGINLSFSNAKGNFLEKNLQKLKWGKTEVIFLEDNTLPIYEIKIYFADGALSDGEKYGLTQMAFDLIDSGTDRYNHQEVSDYLDFFAVNFSGMVLHEYSQFSYSGLTKDVVPTSKMICHLFNKSQFPEHLIKNYSARKKVSLSSLRSRHDALIQRVFRGVLFKGTAYEKPSDGMIKTVDMVTREDLQRQLKYFLTEVKKKLYIQGPKSLLSQVRGIFENDCGFKKSGDKVRQVEAMEEKIKKYPHVYFVPVEKANQMQLMYGDFRLKNNYPNVDEDLEKFASNIVSGGFNSIFFQELREKRGYIYSSMATTGWQRDYGRSTMSTYTKNENILDVLKTIETSIKNNAKFLTPEKFKMFQKQEKGHFLFRIESKSSLFSQVVYLDHLGKDFKTIYEYPQKVSETTREELSQAINKTFGVKNFQLMLLGDKKMMGTIKKAYPDLTVINFEDYL